MKNDIGPLETLNPSVTKLGSIAFDVPANRGYQLLVSGGFFTSDSALISVSPNAEERREERKLEQEIYAENWRREQESKEAVKKAIAEAKKRHEESKWRIWRSSDQKFTTEAKFISSANGVVNLEKRDGNMIAIPRDKLSANDHDYIKNYKPFNPNPAPPPKAVKNDPFFRNLGKKTLGSK